MRLVAVVLVEACSTPVSTCRPHPRNFGSDKSCLFCSMPLGHSGHSQVLGTARSLLVSFLSNKRLVNAPMSVLSLPTLTVPTHAFIPVCPVHLSIIGPGFSVSARAANSDTGLSEIGDLIKAATKEPSKPRAAQSPLKSPAVEQAGSSAGPVSPAEQLDPVAQRSPSATTISESFGRVAESSKEQLSDAKQVMSRAAEGSSTSSIREAEKAAPEQPSPSFSSAPDAGSPSTPAQPAADTVNAAASSVPDTAPGDSNLGAPEGGLDSIRASVNDVKEGLLNQASDFQSSASQTMQGASETCRTRCGSRHLAALRLESPSLPQAYHSLAMILDSTNLSQLKPLHSAICTATPILPHNG